MATPPRKKKKKKKKTSVLCFWLTAGENIDYVTQYLANNMIFVDALVDFSCKVCLPVNTRVKKIVIFYNHAYGSSRVDNCVFSLRGHSVLLPWIQTLLSENPEIVFTKSKRIIWALSFAENGVGFLILLKTFSWGSDIWVTLGDFKVNNANLEGESETKCGVQ